MAYIKDTSVRHIPKFGGNTWFVSAKVAASGEIANTISPELISEVFGVQASLQDSGYLLFK